VRATFCERPAEAAAVASAVRRRSSVSLMTIRGKELVGGWWSMVEPQLKQWPLENPPKMRRLTGAVFEEKG
jgi:hypothetical protein